MYVLAYRGLVPVDQSSRYPSQLGMDGKRFASLTSSDCIRGQEIRLVHSQQQVYGSRGCFQIQIG